MRDFDDIDFTQEDENIIIDTFLNELLQDANTKVLEQDINNIKIASREIITLLSDSNSKYQKIIEGLRKREKASQKVEQYKRLIDSNATINNSNTESLKNTLQQWEFFKKKYTTLFYTLANQSYSQNLFKTILNYQNKLNKLLGQETEVHFVLYNAGKPLVYKLDLNDDASIKKFIQTRYNKTTFTGAFSGVSKAALDELHYSALAGDEYDMSPALSNTYHNVMYRYNQARKKNSRWIYWYEDNDINGMEIAQKGDINEAYALFFFKKKEFINAFNEEKNVKFYAEEGIATVDAVSGLLKGDISLSNGRELAIKSLGASMLGFSQVENIAKKIVYQWDKKNSKEFLKALFQEKIDAFKVGTKSQGRNKLLKDVSQEVAKTVKKDAEKTLKSYTVFHL